MSAMTAMCTLEGLSQRYDDQGNLQRYDDQGHRLVVGCIPYKYEGSELKVLMVRSQSGKNLVLPKGGWELNETAEQAAAREAEEEAGVKGISKESLGKWIFYKAKRCWSINPKGACQIEIFPLEVTDELKNWPEQHRTRQWIKATKLIGTQHHTDWIRESLEKFLETFNRRPRVEPPIAHEELMQRIPATPRAVVTTTSVAAEAAAAAAATVTAAVVGEALVGRSGLLPSLATWSARIFVARIIFLLYR